MLKKITVLFLFFLLMIPCCFAEEKDIEVSRDKGGIYIFKIPLNKYKDKIKPYVSEELTTTKEVFNNKDLNFKLVVNGGFFDPNTGEPASIVKIDGKTVESIFSNTELMKSLEESGRIEEVLNRTELRIKEDTKNNLSFDIVNHFYIPKIDETVKHSIQAGPMIIPSLRLEEESFITYKDRRAVQLAADVLKRRERTIIGLKKGILGTDYLYIIIFTKDHKVALNEARDYCLKLGLNKAMAMDGGGSTSINYRDIEILSDDDSQRKIKSFLVVENDEIMENNEQDNPQKQEENITNEAADEGGEDEQQLEQ